MCRDTINLIIHNLTRKKLYYLSLTSTFYHELIQFKKINIKYRKNYNMN